MKIDRVIGSRGIRATTAGLLAAALAAWGLLLWAAEPARNWLTAAAIAGSILAALSLIHSFRTLYAAWMRLAHNLNKVMTTVLFGAVYFLIVPPFALVTYWRDPLGLQRSGAGGSFWKQRDDRPATLETLQRMG